LKSIQFMVPCIDLALHTSVYRGCSLRCISVKTGKKTEIQRREYLNVFKMGKARLVTALSLHLYFIKKIYI